MGVQGQFEHPLVLRAKLEIAAACHAHGKVASHCVVTEFKDTAALTQAVCQASQSLGYTVIHSPAQIRPIVHKRLPWQPMPLPRPQRFCWRPKAPTGAPSAMRGFCTIAPATAITGKYCNAQRKPVSTLSTPRWFAEDGQLKRHPIVKREISLEFV